MKSIYTKDTRQNCTDLSPTEERYTLCLYEDETCEQTIHANEYGWGPIQIVVNLGIIAVFLATPCQFIFELLCIYLLKIKQDTDKAADNCMILSFQLFLAVIYSFLLFLSIHDIYNMITFGRAGQVMSTFVFCLLLDNFKSFVTLSLIYCIVVRRFMHLDVNDSEFIDVTLPKIPKQENQIPKLKVFCLKFLESTPVEGFSMFVITLYTVFILFWLTHAEFTGPENAVDDLKMASIDTVFLNFFLMEIVLKTFASNLMYLYDGFNLFDAFVVILSEVLNLMSIIIKGISVLRLIRVVVIILRKITGNQSKLRHQNKNNNPVESVIKIFEQIIELEEVTNSVKKEAKWAIELIESNKLYELNFEIQDEEKNMDMDAKTWLQFTTDSASDTSKWFERDLDDFLKEIHRENEEIDNNKVYEEEDRLKQIIEVAPRVWNYAIKVVDDMHKWNFDVFKYYETLGDAALLHFGMKLF